MNRTVECRRFATDDLVPGEIVVAPFRHPERGTVRFPVAEAVAADLRRRGRKAVRVRRTEVECSPLASRGWIVTASYLDRSGSAVGMGIGVHRDDTAGIALAERVIDTWRAVWRTRRAVLAPTGSCSTTEVCPHVELARVQLDLFARRGDHAVVIGGSGASAPGRAGTSAVRTVRDVASLAVDPDRVAYLVQPGFVVEDAAPVIAALRSRFPGIRGAHPDNICYGPSDRRLTLRILAATCDLVLVAGAGHPDPDLSALAGASAVHEIADASELRAEWLGSAESIGVIARSAARPAPTQGIIEALSGLGPLSVARRGVVTDLLSATPGGWGAHSGTAQTPHRELATSGR
ncbi:hypothetical protein WEH80_25120 [Actinomycetes bacterium KLBMP 9759]